MSEQLARSTGATEQSVLTASGEQSELDILLQRSFRPSTTEASVAVRSAINTLAEYANFGKVKVSRDVVLTIESMVAEIDDKLSAQMNRILHNKEYQKLESSWRGLSYLVDNTGCQ